jgi:hypothetical protein
MRIETGNMVLYKNLIKRSEAALVFGILVALLTLLFPPEGRAEPCEPAAATEGLAVFDTIIGPIKVDTAFLGDPFGGDAAPSMHPTFYIWYPDAKPVDPATKLQGWLGPCDGSDDFIVSFRLEETADDAKPHGEFSSIARRRTNLRETGADLFQGFPWADHNLDGPVSGDRDYFVLDDMGERIATLSCSAWRGAAAPPQPSCHGRIGFLDQGFVVRVRFPSRMGFDGTIAKWRDVADFIDEQLALWRS